MYTGYLGSGEQIAHVRHIMDTLLVPGGARIVDPAMADNGKLYAGFDAAFVEKMKTLAFSADILLPNITEAALLTGMEYRKEYDEAYIEELTAALHEKGRRHGRAHRRELRAGDDRRRSEREGVSRLLPPCASCADLPRHGRSFCLGVHGTFVPRV